MLSKRIVGIRKFVFTELKRIVSGSNDNHGNTDTDDRKDTYSRKGFEKMRLFVCGVVSVVFVVSEIIVHEVCSGF